MDIRGRACQVQRSEGRCFPQGASVATEVNQASGEWWEVRSERTWGPWEHFSFYSELFFLRHIFLTLKIK